MIGRPGAGVFQMNGQPTAQNAREQVRTAICPASATGTTSTTSGSSPSCGTSTRPVIPHWAPPPYALQLFRYVEQGSISLLWIAAPTRRCRSPSSPVVRGILGGDEVFVVVQDLFMTETASLADVVLPAANQGEKIGTFTNADRTVHISEKAIDPPGSARPDLTSSWTTRADGLRGRDGGPLLPWSGPEEVFKACRRPARPGGRATTQA